MEKIWHEMASTIIDLNAPHAIELAHQALTNKWDLLTTIEKGFAVGIRQVGELYENGEFFIPELMMAAKIMQDVIKIIEPHFGHEKHQSQGIVVLATIEGDLHSIGKDIVGLMLRANQFEVIDLGADVNIETIVEKANESHAHIIGISALLTTTMIGQKRVVELLKKKGLRDKFKVIVGGAPISADWARECGADGYAGSAIEAVTLVKTLLSLS